MSTHGFAEILLVLIGPVLFSTVSSFFIFTDREKYKLSKPIVVSSLIAFSSGLIAILNIILIFFVFSSNENIFYYSELSGSVIAITSLLSFLSMVILILTSDIHQKNFKLTKALLFQLWPGP